MRIHILIAAVAACTCMMAAQAQERQPGVIKGRVTDAVTGAGVPSQNVMIAGTRIGTTTDETGSFMLSNVPSGKHVLQVTGIGYTAVTMEVVLGSRSTPSDVSVTINQEALPLAEVQITVEAAAKTVDMPVSMHELSLQQIHNTAGSLDDVARALSILPGVAPMRIERHDLIVRGGAPMENLFTVDNIEFPTISHFAVQGAGAGSSSIINTDFIERVAFSSGGFGARNGDKLSSVLSLSMREGNRERCVGAATLSATQFGITVEGPATQRGSYLVSVRRSYLEPVFKAYDMSFAPVYWDVCAKAAGSLGGADNIEVLAIGNRDRMHLFNDTPGKQDANSEYVFSDQDMLIGGVTWRHLSNKWFTVVTGANSYGSYRYYQDRLDVSKSSRIASYENEASLSIDGAVRVSGSTEISAGAKCKGIRFRDDVRLGDVPWFLNVDTDLKELRRSVDTSGRKFAGYLQVSQSAGNVVVNAGVRADLFTLIEHPAVIAPRVSVMYRPSSAIEVTAAAGRYFQAPAYVWLVNPYNTRLRHAGADHVVLGVTQRLGDVWKISVEGYRKTYFDYPASIEAPCMTVFNAGSLGTNFKDFGLDSLTSGGRGVSQGIDLMVQKSISDAPLSGTLSLSYGETRFTALDGIGRAADHDQRWVLNLVLDYHLEKKWGITGKFRLYTGHPYTDKYIMHYGTLAQYEQEYNALRVGVNHSVDVRVMRRWSVGDSQIEAFIDVQNIYNKKPLDTPEFDTKTGRYRETDAIGIVPSVGIKVTL
jgi:hypothetical protein